jgi:3-oxoacyl-[acyl-carrier protein] reductase
MNSAKVAIITGSATGLGAAAAIRLAKAGCRIVINYSKSRDEAEATAQSCRDTGADAIVFQADVGDDSACRAMAQAAIDRWARIDYLVNNAARTKFIPYRNLEDLAGDDFLDIYRVNVVGAYQMSRAVAPHMKRLGAGAIVNTSSIGGATGIGSSMAYAASKAALNVMTRSLALALAPEIRVNAIAPGVIQTRWLKGGLGEEAYEELLLASAESAPLRLAPTADQIAESLVWFLEGASVVTGEVLTVDAGMHCGQLPASFNPPGPDRR